MVRAGSAGASAGASCVPSWAQSGTTGAGSAALPAGAWGTSLAKSTAGSGSVAEGLPVACCGAASPAATALVFADCFAWSGFSAGSATISLSQSGIVRGPSSVVVLGRGVVVNTSCTSFDVEGCASVRSGSTMISWAHAGIGGGVCGFCVVDWVDGMAAAEVPATSIVVAPAGSTGSIVSTAGSSSARSMGAPSFALLVVELIPAAGAGDRDISVYQSGNGGCDGVGRPPVVPAAGAVAPGAAVAGTTAGAGAPRPASPWRGLATI
mmetsp:Transcript_86322/g.279511  ORF Transcript_86322/g.279511 Transcript_86322/m.279511 type:complete len:266 (+) Transcript_86322:580-1377(+)